jgi:hypothetical protein
MPMPGTTLPIQPVDALSALNEGGATTARCLAQENLIEQAPVDFEVGSQGIIGQIKFGNTVDEPDPTLYLEQLSE